MKVPYKSPEMLLEEYGEIIRPIKGVSMLPILREDRDAVRILPVKEELKVGDVPLYRKPNGQYILHRIVAVEKKHYIIRGDNCVALETVPKKWVVGVANGFFRDGQYVPENDPEYLKYVETVLAEGKPLIPAEWRYLLKLYAAAIACTKPPEPPADLDWRILLQKSSSQLIMAVVATSIEKLENPPPAEIFEAFVKARYAALRRDILYDVEREKIYAALDEEGIPYASLKGITIKGFYRVRGIREFIDNDILFDTSCEEKLNRIMKRLGYKLTTVSPVHDTYCKDNLYCFEMHKRLFSEKSDLNYEDVWSHFKPRAEGSFAHYMSNEEAYVYFMAHYAKHRRTGGVGIKFLGDLYFLKKHYLDAPDFDRAYVESRLEKLDILDVEKQAILNIDALFGKGELSDDEIRTHFRGGSHGSFKRRLASEIESRGRLGYMIRRLFPPVRLMRCRYPVLRRAPILLPVFWVVRLVQHLFDSNELKNTKKTLKVWLRLKKTKDNDQ